MRIVLEVAEPYVAANTEQSSIHASQMVVVGCEAFASCWRWFVTDRASLKEVAWRPVALLRQTSPLRETALRPSQGKRLTG